MKLFISAALLLPIMLVFATANTPAKACQDYNIPVTVTSQNFIFGPRFENDFDVVDFLTDANSRTANVTLHPFTSIENQTASYSISATFCTPRYGDAPKKDTVLLMSHGVNFDRSYWNPGIQPEKYSFVDFAIGKGYSTFYYDRLGVGESTLVSGYINQPSIQVAILQSLAHSIRSGQYTGSIGKPKALVLVGHSFGSALSAGALTVEPDLADGVILTGFSYAGNNPGGFTQAGGFRIAAKQHPGKWRQLDNGYLTLVDLYANINCFFKKPFYDVAVTKYADANKKPVAINELITLGVLNTRAVDFTGAAMVIAGQHDFIFCTSECDDILEPAAALVFGKARAFKAVSYPGAGHGLNFALNATGAFEIITDFLADSGL